MQYAICNEVFGDWTWQQGMKLASDAGYSGLEVAPFTLGPRADQVSAETRAQYRDMAASHGLKIIGLHWLLAKTEGFHLTTNDSAVRQRTASYLGDLARLCEDLGGDLMVLGSPMQRNFGPEMTHQQAMENAADVLRRCTDVLEDTQVAIAVEPLGPQEGNFLNHALQARKLIEAVDHPFVQLHLDVKAMSTEGAPIDKIIRDNADLMIHFHANDPNRLGPGMGEVDFVPIFRSLHDVDYQGWVSVEVFDYSPGPEKILRESMQNMLQADKLSRSR
jgi:sugar phosphate isomerase/epimerase